MKTQTTVQTAMTEKYTKKSKQKVVTQKIVTTIKTTTTVANPQQNVQTQEVSFQSSELRTPVRQRTPVRRHPSIRSAMLLLLHRRWTAEY